MNLLEKRLAAETTAELRFDKISCEVWASDASIFKITPLGIALPKTQEDLEKIVAIATELSIPLVARGAGTGISGGCLGHGLIVDTSKYLNRIKEIHLEEEYVVVEPGVILDDLNRALAANGYRLGPETSTGNRATLGGMAANNASGARSLRYGKMVDHILAVEMVLQGGKRVRFHEMTEGEWESKIHEESPLGRIVRTLEHIRDVYKEDIILHYPKINRRVSGYNLDELFSSMIPNLAKFIVGSEGSLGIISELKLKICKAPQACGIVILHFHQFLEAFQALPQMLHWEPLSLEMLDHQILKLASSVPRLCETMGWLKGEPEAILLVEFDAYTSHEVKLRLSAFEADMRLHGIGYAYSLVSDPKAMAQVWEVRKAGLGLLMSKRSYTSAIAFLEDIAIPVDRLAEFLEKFLHILQREGKEAGIYGHIGAGCLHIRPYLNLSDPADLERIPRWMQEVSSLILDEGGALSGEHGDGLIRSWLNKKMFGPKVYEAFLKLKYAFDPANIMNPGKVVQGDTFDKNIDYLRLNPSTKTLPFETFLDFSREGGFALAVDLCNGNGLCRKKEKLMCPSFQATGDEYDSTRARANSLQALIHGKLPTQGWADPGVYQVLDLCLMCKGCKAECPSQVDMAKMKTEFLYHYHAERGLPLRERLLSNFPRFFRWGSLFPNLFNKLQEKRWFKALQNRVGIVSERNLPTLAEVRFSKWFEKHIKGKQRKGKRIVLFNDTYTEFHAPEIGKSAVRILHALGYEVVVPPWHCCGRPLLSKGRLKEAQKLASKLIQTLIPYAKAKVPIVGLEPSCILTLMDEYRDFPHLEAKGVIELCQTFDTFLADHLVNGKLPLHLKKAHTQAKVHGHCFQKALIGMKPTLDVLQGAGYEVEEIPSGCCGMAGSFGYEKEHYELSLKIGELVLLPTVRAASKDTLIVASGLSCRTQIADFAGRSAIHLAEAIARQIQT